MIKSLNTPLSEPSDLPPLQVLLPCRGLDPGLKENLLAVLHQDYPDYQVLFLIDSLDDLAAPIIREAIAEAPDERGSIHVVDLDIAPGSSGKVRALISGMREVPQDREVIVTADSDIRPHRKWLARLVSSLKE